MQAGFYCYVNAAGDSSSILKCMCQGSAVAHVIPDRNKLCFDTGKAGDYSLLNFFFSLQIFYKTSRGSENRGVTAGAWGTHSDSPPPPRRRETEGLARPEGGQTLRNARYKVKCTCPN